MTLGTRVAVGFLGAGVHAFMLGVIQSGDVQMDLSDYACLGMPRGRPAAPERHRTPLGRATAPRLPHTAALGDPGEKTGGVQELGERGFF